MGITAPDEDEFEEDEESDDPEDEGVLEEAAEADRDGAAADDVGEPSTSYPEPPNRVYRASDLFGEAAVMDAALWLASSYPDVLVTGLQSNPHLVVPGDIFVLHPGLIPDDDLDAISVAVEQGATVIVAPRVKAEDPGLDPAPDPVGLAGILPDEVPLIRVEDSLAMGARLAAAFYDLPSANMVTIGVMGLLGKTTTAWLIRGLLEELGQTVGLVSTIEHAIAEDRLDEDGYLWEPMEEDPSAERESSVPFKLIPYAGKRQRHEFGPFHRGVFVPHLAVLISRLCTAGKYEQHYKQTLPGLNSQKLLAGMRDRAAGVAVMEMGTKSLALGTFDYVDLNVAVVTGLSVHMGVPASEQPEDRADEVRAAAELAMITLERKLTQPEMQVLVINADDPATEELLRRLNNAVPVVTFGMSNSRADVFVESYKNNIWETEVIIRTPTGRLQIITNLLGRHNAYNLVAAVATGVALKAPLQSIVAGIEAVEIPGRSEVIDEGQEFSVVVDAAQSPETLASMLDALRRGGARQIFTVFGCSGNEDPSIRPKMGAVAHAKSDYVIVTNENPRLEDPAKDQGRTPLWFEPYLQKAQRDNKRYIMEDRYSAIRAAIGTAGPEDVVLLAGKGHQDWVEHADTDGNILRGWLDDRVEARNALSKLKYLKQIPKFNRDTLPWGSRIETLMETLAVDPGVLTRPGPVDTNLD
ncbi:hypothetical protein VOLCADRAFT_119843 [Volvox carteri f. nagariensis]|uniref:Mur ligase central domain-containing protein n=1 Tax=Volvox carteri f. nagariensis TaxID=3068 RepID=D8UHG1_VOLCA|nr:uncharacterized protein VOLCADRAFT_119843 [Volvox carteri f. nagariensis]EFJ40847.1 hypothetical protein VOLCADRAFT_119843 [Volvox carteri f. nagariensis]|eukprot:XP_002958116.1 hypothetical protein VOLCADRAFT_119843 [Volvox carteri f. nagariensis]